MRTSLPSPAPSKSWSPWEPAPLMSSRSCLSITELGKLLLDPDSYDVDLAGELVDLRGGGEMAGDWRRWQVETGSGGLGFEAGRE